MEARPSMTPSRPQSIKELVAQAENFVFNVNIAMKHWIRTADTLYQEASFALSDGDYGRAYKMLYRHSVLVLKYLPTHPQFKDPENKKAYKLLSKRIDRVIDSLEQLKPEIESAYKEWERTAPSAAERYKKQASSSYASFAAHDPSLSGRARILDAAEHQDLAVDLAQQELSRRERDKRTSKHGSIWDARISKQHGNEERRYAENRASQFDDGDLRRQMEATRRTLDMAQERREIDAALADHDQTPPVTTTNYHYPSLSKPRPIEYEQIHHSSSREAQPTRPPKERFDVPPSRSDDRYDIPKPMLPPQVPRKTQLGDYQQPDATSRPVNQPPLPPKTSVEAPQPKKERLAFKPGGYLENGDPIRSIFLPSSLRARFLELAAKNTAAGLETCGVLCGTPINNALFVRCLLIPDQKSTPDTCETENESALFDYCMSEDLLMLGWIHTHPTQTCFMSSRDLHTHAGYQVMMPESIAIVCAPRYNEHGIFRLTHPPGLDHILNCSRTETFHQHSIDNLYREAYHPEGHVYESDKMPLQVVDLRMR
ncbi:AMSH-like protease sst2 [Trichoderma ghanense]|uniref:AMSH-like protease sst2 n=1 Tax=Trichoderma ghanense TaxID=65468 RepID=A0ABY2HHQ7_9HYPO